MFCLLLQATYEATSPPRSSSSSSPFPPSLTSSSHSSFPSLPSAEAAEAEAGGDRLIFRGSCTWESVPFVSCSNVLLLVWNWKGA